MNTNAINIEQALNRHQKRKQQTRKLLKQVTIDLLIEKGYDALTVQDITDRADLARGTFYVHFKDKDEAVWAILSESFDDLAKTLYDDLPADTAQWHFRKWQRLFEFVDANRNLLNVLMGEKGHITLYQRIADHIAQTIQQDMEAGVIARISSQPVPFAAQFIAGSFMQVVTWWLKHPQTYTSRELTGMVYELVLRELPPKELLEGR